MTRIQLRGSLDESAAVLPIARVGHETAQAGQGGTVQGVELEGPVGGGAERRELPAEEVGAGQRIERERVGRCGVGRSPRGLEGAPEGIGPGIESLVLAFFV